MKVFVTGSTGFVGSNLVNHLISLGNPVRILAKSETKAKPLVELGAELICGDITDEEVIKCAISDVETVYHLAGRLYSPDIPTLDYYHVHVAGTEVLLKCCLRQSSIRRFIHVSTTGVLGKTGEIPLDENAPCIPSNAYEDSKWKAELIVHEANKKGLPAVIIRPGLVYGPGDLHLLGFFRSIKFGLFRPIGSKSVSLHPIYINDLLEALLLSSQVQQAIGESYHIAAEKYVTVSELASTIAFAQGKKLPEGYIPIPLALLIAIIGDNLPNKLKPIAPLTTSRLDFLTSNRIYNVSKAKRDLGFNAKTELSDGIAKTVAWYQNQGYL